MKKILFIILAALCLAACSGFSEKEKALFRVDFMDACCNYEAEKGKVARSYMSLGIKEGKYIPDTVKIKTELDSCIRVLMSESFDSIFINYSENFLKDRIIGYKSKEEFYQKWVDKGVEEVMSVIRREINYRKIMNPTEDDKIEFLKECELIQ